MSGMCEGRVCIVTGAGRGIGREHALMLASEGAKVVVNDLGGNVDGTGGDQSPAQQVVEEIKGTEKPFDYELPAPAAGQLPYAQAKAKALALKTGAVEQWEVKPPENQYEFYVRDANERLWEIKLTADKGETKSVEEKAVAD